MKRKKLSRAKPSRSTASARVNAKRAATVKQRWAEARLYAERHGTTPRLDRRTVEVKLTNDAITKATRGLFSHKRRLSGGRRGSESKAIPDDAYFKLSIALPNGQTVKSGTLRLPPKGTDLDVTRVVRRANNGVFRSQTDYDQVEDVEVSDDGDFSMTIDGESGEAAIFIEPDFDDEPLIDEGDDDDESDDGDEDDE